MQSNYSIISPYAFLLKMDLRSLRYFLAVAESQHVTRAAQLLHVTQSTLSHQIQQLEQSLGTPLFDRVGRGIRLTQAGELYRVFAQRALQEIENGSAAVAELEHVVSGRLRIGVIHTINSSLVPGVVGRFLDTYPGVRVTIEEMSAPAIEAGLVQGDLDLGISLLSTTSDEVEAEKLFDERLVLIVRRDSPHATLKSMRASGLKGIKLALLSPRFITRRLVDQWYGRHCAEGVMLEMNSIEALLNVVRAGSMATILNERALMREDDLVKVLLTHPVTMRGAAMLWSRSRYRLPAARRFAEMFTEGMQR